MRVLVLGGTAFIGAAVVRRLVENGHEVAVFHRGESEAELPAAVRHIHGERERLAEHREALKRFAPAAAIDMRAMLAAEADAALAVLHDLVGRAVLISSVDVYRAYGRMHGTEPGPPEPVPFAEDAPLREQLYPYRGGGRGPMYEDYDKIPVERLYLDDAVVASTVVRLPAVYGPGDRQHRLWPWLRRMDDGRAAIPIEASLAGWRWHSAYVEDIAAAIVLALESDSAIRRVYNAASPDAPPLAEWVRTIGRVAGWQGEVVLVPDGSLGAAAPLRVETPQDMVADTRRIRAELGFHEIVDLDTGLRRTIAWERANPPVGDTAPDYATEDAALAAVRGG
jgi:nucleoside-diphosphate-sugar epimerase